MRSGFHVVFLWSIFTTVKACTLVPQAAFVSRSRLPVLSGLVKLSSLLWFVRLGKRFTRCWFSVQCPSLKVAGYRQLIYKIVHPAAHSHNSFPSGIAVEPGEQQALTYLNRERKVFWAGICLFPSSYPARFFRNEGFSLTGKEIELPWQPRPHHPFQPVRRAQNMALSEVHSVRRVTYKQDQQWRTARRRLWRDVCDFTDGCLRNGWV